MPLHQYRADRGNVSSAFVPFAEYVRQVLSDPESTRAADASWISYAFNASLLKLMERGRTPHVLQRGLQTCFQEYQVEGAARYGDSILPNMLYDKHEAQTRVNELCGAIAKLNLPTYFGTITCNQPNFPGVRRIHRILTGNNVQPWSADVVPYLVFFQMAWHRSVNLFMEWVRLSAIMAHDWF